MAVASRIATGEYWLRGCIATNICLKEALLEILHDLAIGGLPRNKAQLYIELKKFKQSKVGMSLTRGGILKSHQWQIMCHTCNTSCQNPCPENGYTDSDDLDVTSIITLIRNCTKIPTPKGGWSQDLPHAGDTSKEACVLVIRFIRNFLMHCSLKRLQTKADFDNLVWKRMEKVLLDLGYKNMALFYSLEKVSLDQYTEQRIDALNQRFIALEDIVQGNKDDINQIREDFNDFIKLTKHWKYRLEEKRVVNRKHILNIQKILSTGNEKMKQLEERFNKLEIELRAEIEDINTRIDGIEFENERKTDVLIKEKSDDLKKKMIARYQKVKVAFAPSSSLKCNDAVDRDDIVVDLSLVADAETVSQMADVSDFNTVSEIRKKYKEEVENKIEYNDILTSSNDYVLISGGPGSGKTTLIETLVHKWASNDLWNDYDFVYVIYLRDLVRFKNNPDITAEGIFSHYYPGHESCTDAQHLIILEGFDELFGKANLKSEPEEYSNYTQAIYDLLDPDYQRLPFTRIVTSRPGACPLLQDSVLLRCGNVRVYEILGFSDENIKRYIRKHITDQDAEEAINKLESMPFIYEMMVIPFYCWGICYLVKNEVSIEELGQTLTSLYTHLLILFIRNHGLRSPTMKLKDVLEDPKFKEVCIGLAKMVAVLVQSGKILFTKDDLEGTGIDIENIIKNSGIIMEIYHDDSLTTTYCFLHYTFHEYLVALCMFLDFENSFEKIFTANRSHGKDLQVLAGLIGGIKDGSKSNAIVQKFCKMFGLPTQTKYFPVLSDTVLSLESFIEMVYEFQNDPIVIDDFICQFMPVGNTNPYFNRGCRYFIDCCVSGQLKIKTLHIIDNFGDDKEEFLTILILNILSCADTCFKLF